MNRSILKKIINIFIAGRLCSNDKVDKLCRQAYREGHAYAVGGHDSFNQIHLTEDEWINQNL